MSRLYKGVEQPGMARRYRTAKSRRAWPGATS